MRYAIFAFAIVGLISTQSHAWGKRGHAIVCEVAAHLAADKVKKAHFLRDHSFDLAYYCNVPDLIWKAPATYEKERNNHFMDMEIFDRGLKEARDKDPFVMERRAFEAAFPSIPESAGRSWWRIRELVDESAKISSELKKEDLSKERRHELQADWLVRAGAIGHYIGDLAQPLHVTENYDGQMTGQKGIHAFFEDDVVDELYLSTEKSLTSEVLARARARDLSKREQVLEMLKRLSKDSGIHLPELLKIDKKTDRKDLRKAARAYRTMIVERMAEGARVLASVWVRDLEWNYDGHRFYRFQGEPAFIAPPAATP